MRQLTVFFSLLSLCVSANPFTLYASNSGLIHSDVRCIEQGEKYIWIGTQAGINRILFKGSLPVQFSKRATSVPVTALEDDGDVIWAGLKGKGVYQMLKKNFKLIGFRKDVLRNKEILNIERTKNGLVVFTSGQKYVFSFGKEEYSVSEINFEKYNPNIEVGGKIIRNKGGVLSRFNLETKSFRPFKGMINARGHLNWENGVLFATSKGLSFYNPNNDIIEFGSPKLDLLGFQLNGIDTSAFELDLNWDEYEFSYQFRFEELGDPDQIKLFYTLDNGEELIEKTAFAFDGIEIKDLDHGSYHLKIKAKNNNGIESKNTLNYSFSIANPLTNSIWRYVVILVSISIWTFMIISIVKTRFKKQMRILEDALIEKTNKLNQIEKSKYGLVEEDKAHL